MLTAAAAWDALAAELQSAASSYAAVVNGLADEAWAGPSAAAMAAAAAPYVAWLAATSAQARTAAEQATAAASAFESAFAAVVPPAEIATNRARLAMLSASNVFGQNSAAIAAAEAEYGQMWAQDAAAMFGYASASAAATRLAPFTEPPKTTNDAGIAAQAAALGEATGRGPVPPPRTPQPRRPASSASCSRRSATRRADTWTSGTRCSTPSRDPRWRARHGRTPSGSSPTSAGSARSPTTA